MPFRLRHSVCATLILSLSAGAVLSAHADTGRYLTWQHKAETQSETPQPVVTAGGQTYAVPTSPYGQVGDPYARHLNWPTKPGAQTQQRQAAQAVAPQPVQQMASIAPVPVPTRSAPAEFAPPPQSLQGQDASQGQGAPQRPQAVTGHTSRYVASHPAPTTLEPEDDDTAAASAPIASVSAPIPVARPRPVTVPAQAVATPQAPSRPAQLRPAVKAPTPTATAQSTPPAQPMTAPVQTASQGYQVPATSKYAARIAAARASAAADNTQTVAANTAPQAATKPAVQPSGKADPKTKAKPASTTAGATAPEATPQLATQETDHVFIPGEQYTNPDEAPRLYSLHRAYGLKPDPITVDHDATGAILDATHLTDGDVQTKDSSSDSEDDADADSTAKTKKADQQ